MRQGVWGLVYINSEQYEWSAFCLHVYASRHLLLRICPDKHKGGGQSGLWSQMQLGHACSIQLAYLCWNRPNYIL